MGMVSYYTRIRTTNSNTNTISNITTTSNKIMRIKVRNNNIESALSILRRRSKEIILSIKRNNTLKREAQRDTKRSKLPKPGRTSGSEDKLLKREVRKYNGV